MAAVEVVKRMARVSRALWLGTLLVACGRTELSPGEQLANDGGVGAVAGSAGQGGSSVAGGGFAGTVVAVGGSDSAVGEPPGGQLELLVAQGKRYYVVAEEPLWARMIEGWTIPSAIVADAGGRVWVGSVLSKQAGWASSSCRATTQPARCCCASVLEAHGAARA